MANNYTLNRLILIGNGFDLAHGLPTSYNNFIDEYWNGIISDIENQISSNIESGNSIKIHNGICYINFEKSESTPERDKEFWTHFQKSIQRNGDSPFTYYKKINNKCFEFLRAGTLKDIAMNENRYIRQTDYILNNFFWSLSRKNEIQNWVDVENEYFKNIVNCIKAGIDENSKIQLLNTEFSQVKELLCKYLKENVENQYDDLTSGDFLKILSGLSINHKEYHKKFIDLVDKKSLKEVTKTVILNFNYTNTVQRYVSDDISVIQIHGNIGDEKKNPVIFGSGDEINDSYSSLENRDNNEYLKHIKSFQYFQTSNYKNLLDLIDSRNFQVYIMGHSCGLSDRVLLNTIFEHENCQSIKIFYHEQEGKDDFTDITMNISRHFKNKARMREIIVNKELCESMPQTKLKKLENKIS